MKRTLFMVMATFLMGLWALAVVGWPAAAWLTVIAAVLVTLTDIDARTGHLPNYYTLPLLASGLVLAPFVTGLYWQQSLGGAVAGAGLAGLVIGVSVLLSGKPGWGMGDLKLLAGLGAWTGASGLLPLILFSSCAAVGWIGWLRYVQGRRVKTLPFGPFLAVAGWLVLLYQPLFWQWLLGQGL